MTYNILFEWVHISYNEQAAFTEIYGFSGNQGAINLESVLIRPEASHPADVELCCMGYA